MKIKLFGIFALVLIVHACEEPVKSNIDIADVESHTLIFDKIRTDSFSFEIYKLIPLETTQNNFLSDNLTVKVSSDFIFVFDEQIRDAIHKFDHNGRYVSQIINVGEGPESVNNVSDFVVSEKKIEILIGKGAYSEIAYYSIDDEKLTNKLKLDIIGFSFEKIGNAYYIYSSYNYPYAEFRVSKVDLQGNILANYLKNDYSGTMLPVVERNFFTNCGRTFLIESFGNKIYELTEQHVKSKYIIDFGRKNIPENFFDNDLMIAFEKLNIEGFYSIINHFEGSNMALTTLVFQQENNSQLYQIIFNKEKQEIVKNKLEGPWEEILKHPVGITDSDQIIFSVSPQLLLKNAGLLNLNALSGIEDDGNPVLVYMKILN